MAFCGVTCLAIDQMFGIILKLQEIFNQPKIANKRCFFPFNTFFLKKVSPILTNGFKIGDLLLVTDDFAFLIGVKHYLNLSS